VRRQGERRAEVDDPAPAEVERRGGQLRLGFGLRLLLVLLVLVLLVLVLGLVLGLLPVLLRFVCCAGCAGLAGLGGGHRDLLSGPGLIARSGGRAG
jgi:uncharacterized membrane protein